jgi:hypothetical protein
VRGKVELWVEKARGVVCRERGRVEGLGSEVRG